MDELVLMNSGRKGNQTAFIVSKEELGFMFRIVLENGQGMVALVPADRMVHLQEYLKRHLGES